MSKMPSLKESGLRWLWVAVVVFVLDYLTKIWVVAAIPLGWQHRIEVLPIFNLLYVRNYGAAFSFLSNQGGWQRWLLSLIALGVCALLAFWMRKSTRTEKTLNIAYALIIGGAIGNLFDRLIHGFVIDFLDFHIGTYHWPSFNVADSAICIGAVLIILDSFRKK
jgi:signal peptidase II